MTNTDINTVAAVKAYLLSLQQRLCIALAMEDGLAEFNEDHWQHASGGGGCTRVIANGRVFEKGAVNFSHVLGTQLPPSATAHHPQLAGRCFQAMGVSLVMHPVNPYAPTTHLNVRFFIATAAGLPSIWWFGGGFDLTPYYGFTEDCQHWHQIAKQACDPFGAELYSRYKKACDQYFYLPHRREPRGIGGIFFDDLRKWPFEQCFAFLQSVGDHFLPAYQPIIHRRKNIPYSQRERNFQCYRRGRYVEFNLLYDRGTLFGIQSGGRTESILVSLPPQVRWDYQWQAEPSSIEAQFYEDFLAPREWICTNNNANPTSGILTSTSAK